MTDNEAVVRRFISAWPRLDVDEIVGFFTEDGVYHNMPIGPIQGHAALRPFITAFLKGWTGTHWDILNIAVHGDVVIAEPKALIGFAGPRVIEQTVREKLPEGFQRAEFLLDKGAVDMIVDRRQLREEVARLIALLMRQSSDAVVLPLPAQP